jgi:predicted hydrocarbon binding protein
MANIVPSYGEEASGGKPALFLLRHRTLSAMTNSLIRSFGHAGVSMIYTMAREGGASEVKALREELRQIDSYPTKRDVLERALLRLSQMGWGKISVAEFDADKGSLRVQVKYNPLLKECGSELAGDCTLLRGLIAGIASEALREEIQYDKTQCLQSGDGCCDMYLSSSLKSVDKAAEPRSLDQLLTPSTSKKAKRENQD